MEHSQQVLKFPAISIREIHPNQFRMRLIIRRVAKVVAVVAKSLLAPTGARWINLSQCNYITFIATPRWKVEKG